MLKYFDDLSGIRNKEGKVIKKGLLLRGTSLINLTEEEKRYFEDVHLKTIIDLRHPMEIEKNPDEVFEGADYFNFSIVENNISAAIQMNSPFEKLRQLDKMEAIEDDYVIFFTDPHCLQEIKKVISTIVKNDSLPVFYHCVSGKDRTGITTILLLEILGMDRETITKAYLRTREVYIVHAWVIYFEALLFSLNPKLALKGKNMYTVKSDYVDISYDTINKNFGSMDNFIHNFLEISEEDIQKFKERVLE